MSEVGRQIDAGDARAVWAALLDELADRPAWGWVEKLRLVSLADGLAVLEPAAGQREILGFFNEAKQKQLGERLGRLTGGAVRVRVRQPEAGDGQEAGDTDTASEADARVSSAADRRAAMDLPLMKEVLEYFPDAVLMDVRGEEGKAKE